MQKFAIALLSVLCVISFARARSNPDRLNQFLQNYLGKPNPLFEQQGPTQLLLCLR
jgi:hypothetical protein